MKYLSFNILILSILMPPVLYLATIHGLEEYYLTERYQDKIENIYLAGMNSILSGEETLQDSVRESILRFTSQDMLMKMGVDLNITIASRRGLVIYPPAYQPGTPADIVNEDPIETARENFQILQNGLDVAVSAVIRLYSAMAMSILLIYILLSGSGLYLYFNTASFKARREEQEKAAELDRLHRLEDEFNKQFDKLTTERESLVSEYQILQSSLEEQKRKAAKNEEEMFDEIEKLESRLTENLEEQDLQAKEILDLEEKINELEKLRENIIRQKEKSIEKLGKRFKALYKNIDVHERSLLGIDDLTDDMALKAEELIHQLNADPSAVLIKRKVFCKKGRVTAFEVVFSYNGRLYFKKNGQQKIEVLAVGTKNSQARDLAYLDRAS
jgi:predicted  nucleic acid-binding Zn-ribbon protein